MKDRTQYKTKIIKRLVDDLIIRKGEKVTILPFKMKTNIKKQFTKKVKPTGKNDNIRIKKAIDSLK